MIKDEDLCFLGKSLHQVLKIPLLIQGRPQVAPALTQDAIERIKEFDPPASDTEPPLVCPSNIITMAGLERIPERIGIFIECEGDTDLVLRGWEITSQLPLASDLKVVDLISINNSSGFIEKQLLDPRLIGTRPAIIHKREGAKDFAEEPGVQTNQRKHAPHPPFFHCGEIIRLVAERHFIHSFPAE